MKNGGISLYYTVTVNGKRIRKTMDIFLLPERTPQDKKDNDEKRILANRLKAKLTMEFYEQSYKLKKTRKEDANLIEYAKYVMDLKVKRGSEGIAKGIRSLVYHLVRYKGKHITLRSVDAKYLTGFIDYLKRVKSIKSGAALRKSTRANYYSLLETVIHQAIRDEILEDDPTKSVIPPKKEEIIREFLTLDEVELLANTFCPYTGLKRSFLFCCFTGLRYSDVKSLTWNDVVKDSKGNTLIRFRQKKTGQLNTIPLSDNAKMQLPHVLNRNVKGTDKVFNILSPTHANTQLKVWAKNAGVDKYITFHTSRHTFATLLVNYDANIYQIQQLLGHSSVKTTQIYAKTTDASKQRTVNLIPAIGF